MSVPTQRHATDAVFTPGFASLDSAIAGTAAEFAATARSAASGPGKGARATSTPLTTDAPPTVTRAFPATAAPSIRKAHLDRPLGPGHLVPTYADPELERIVREAAEAARVQARAEGHAEGYAAGWAEGRHAAAAQAQVEEDRRTATAQTFRRIEAERVQSALSAAVAAARDVQGQSALQWAEVGEAIAEGALQLARAVLARELAETGSEAAEAVRIAMRTLGEGDPVVSVNPEDHETLLELAGIRSLGDGVRLIADPTVPRSGAVARSGAKQVLAHLPTALAAAEEAMRA